MSVNIFKNARRIAAVFGIVGSPAGRLCSWPRSMTYLYSWPNEPPKLIDGDGCAPDDATSLSYKYISFGSIYLTLCFKGRLEGSEPLDSKPATCQS
jgi:hypothetical protein